MRFLEGFVSEERIGVAQSVGIGNHAEGKGEHVLIPLVAGDLEVEEAQVSVLGDLGDDHVVYYLVFAQGNSDTP